MTETVHGRPLRVLRTCYRNQPGDIARHQWLLDEYLRVATIRHNSRLLRLDGTYNDPVIGAPGLGTPGHPLEALNDASRYNFGSAYEKVFSVCPDLSTMEKVAAMRLSPLSNSLPTSLTRLLYIVAMTLTIQ